jgi:predicted N-acyltransferase
MDGKKSIRFCTKREFRGVDGFSSIFGREWEGMVVADCGHCFDWVYVENMGCGCSQQIYKVTCTAQGMDHKRRQLGQEQ